MADDESTITPAQVDDAIARTAEAQETSDDGFLRKRAPLRDLMDLRSTLREEAASARRGDVLSTARSIIPRRP